MDVKKLSPADLKQYLHDLWNLPDEQRNLVELNYFGEGKSFMMHGAMPLHTVFTLLGYGLLNVVKIEIEPFWDEFDVVSLTPNFRVLCEAYVPPFDLPFFESSEYDAINDDFDENDDCSQAYQGAPVFLLSETRLMTEIKTRNYNWITYRTPYRLEI